MTGDALCCFMAAFLLWLYLTDRRKWRAAPPEPETPVGKLLAARRDRGL